MTTAVLQVVEPVDNKNFKINEEALKAVLLDPRVADKPVMPVVVVGPFRKGKSFLLNFLIRYLEHQSAADKEEGNEKGIGGDWLDLEQPLNAKFEFEAGSKAHTKGIFLWPEPFALKDPNGKEVMVLLMDSQGNFDPSMGAAQNSAIFALSSLFSSVLIYNIKENIGNDHLESLQFFASYAEMLLSENKSTSSSGNAAAFQSLIFMIRDWEFDREKPFGFDGGQQLIAQNMPENDEGAIPEIKQLRQDVRRLFGSIQAFLMPDPGREVSSGKFTGDLKEIDACFLEQVRQFCESLFSSAVAKRIGGSPVTGKELLFYFHAYFGALHDAAQPEPKSLLRATIEANMLVAKTRAKEQYTEQIERSADGTKSSKELQEIHDRLCQEALQLFSSTKKMGGPKEADAHAAQLKAEIEDRFTKQILQINDLNAEKLEMERKRFEKTESALENMRTNMERVQRELDEKKTKCGGRTRM